MFLAGPITRWTSSSAPRTWESFRMPRHQTAPARPTHPDAPAKKSQETASSTVVPSVVAGHVSNVGEITGLECQELQGPSWPMSTSECLE